MDGGKHCTYMYRSLFTSGINKDTYHKLYKKDRKMRMWKVEIEPINLKIIINLPILIHTPSP